MKAIAWVVVILASVAFFTIPPDAASQERLPQLWVTKIKVGQSYGTDAADNTWGKILQVVDGENMLVGIDNGRSSPGGNPRYSVVVWCKFPTKGLTDGESGFLAKLLSTDRVTVSGTTRYKTRTGGTKTVFVLASAESAIDKLRADGKAADKKAREMMGKAGVSQAVLEWISWIVNRGPLGLPPLTGADRGIAVDMLMSTEVQQWLAADAKYHAARKR